MSVPSQMTFANPWDDPRQQQTLQSPFQQTRENSLTGMQQYSNASSQRAPRVGPIRTMTPGEFRTHARSSASSLSGAMGTASTPQRPKLSPEQSAGSSPSSDGSNQSNHIQELRLHWDMGISGVNGSDMHAHGHDLLSPGNTNGTLLFENLDVSRGMQSPYTPSSTLSDLPDPSALSMTHPSYASSSTRYFSTGRPSSSNGVDQSSPNMLLAQSFPHSAPANNVSGFPHGNLGGMPMHGTPSPPNVFNASTSSEAERLKQIILELQTQNQELYQRVEQLQGEVSAARRAQASGISTTGESMANSNYALSANGMPTGQGQASPSPQMEASWRRRTEARMRKYCSPNRAGNALCAWHDTRRERRAYPPRMAPPGTLNCGCTVSEALFEESLSRHGVGSYLPGDNVRMDPALRNPLLRLLEVRYGYRDGDFERDPATGAWNENEGHERWEAELQRTGGSRHR